MPWDSKGKRKVVVLDEGYHDVPHIQVRQKAAVLQELKELCMCFLRMCE